MVVLFTIYILVDKVVQNYSSRWALHQMKESSIFRYISVKQNVGIEKKKIRRKLI